MLLDIETINIVGRRKDKFGDTDIVLALSEAHGIAVLYVASHNTTREVHQCLICELQIRNGLVEGLTQACCVRVSGITPIVGKNMSVFRHGDEMVADGNADGEFSFLIGLYHITIF